MDYIFLVVGFVILIKGADVLVSGASSVAKRFGISSLVIGLTIVAFGTSAPELFVNVLSALKGQTDLALWNVVGSNIANTLLILGAAAAVYPVTAKSSTIYKEIPFTILASLALLFLTYDTLFSSATLNVINRGESMVLLLFFVIFFVYTFGIAKNTETSQEQVQELSLIKSILFILAGLTGLALGAHFLVGAAQNIALSFGVSESVIGLTIVAFGTSLPELATSIIAALKKNSDIAIGNVVGSNIFNILLVLGFTGIVSDITVSNTIIIDICIQLFAIALLIFFLLFVWEKAVLWRKSGVFFLLLYAIYISYLVTTQIL